MKYFAALMWLVVGIVLAGPMQGVFDTLMEIIGGMTLGTFEGAAINLFPVFYWVLVIGVPFIIVMRGNE